METEKKRHRAGRRLDSSNVKHTIHFRVINRTEHNCAKDIFERIDIPERTCILIRLGLLMNRQLTL